MLIEATAFFASCLVIIFYYFYLLIRVRVNPNASVYAFNANIRRQWINRVIANNQMEILAVQTLRNSMMAANFMATTAVLLIIGALNLSEKIGHWSLANHWFAPAQAVSNQFWQIKLGLLLLDFFIAFFCFSMSIRFYNHVGYMINLPYDADTKARLFKHTYMYLNKAGRYYTFGNRAFYFSFPIVMWFFGPYFLLLGTLLLVVGLAIMDKAPD